MEEIELIQDQDEKVRLTINRKERLNNLLRSTRSTFDRSLTNLEETLNKTHISNNQGNSGSGNKSMQMNSMSPSQQFGTSTNSRAKINMD